MTTRPVAIIGYAFRLPGTASQDFWDALCSGTDLVGSVDGTRWAQEPFFHPRASEPGSSYTFAAGSLGDVSGFDADFFGISPREAAQMDPQQRLLLELTWESFEHAGVKPSSMRGARCGVYIGLSSIDYAYRRSDDLASIESSTMTGNTASIAANRISYWFDLKGPSIAVDTACSSSLVAFHLACQSIAFGESTHAVTGGISLHLHPFPFVGFSKAAMLSKQGRCRVFDAAGDGYVRSEGGGIFLLKNLQEALADGDRILAVVAGSGSNCDGRTNGITVPGADTQAELLQEVYARAGLQAADIDYLEAHGTGTAVGDPIEASAIGQALGRFRPTSSPLLIGSVKSNLGHLEAASGVAGLVKALHCLKYRSVPPSLHLKEPNPRIPFAQWNLRVATENIALDPAKKLVIGVNSFGFGGANAHVILESPDEIELAPRASLTPPAPLLLSGRSEAALQAGAAAFAAHLRDCPWQQYADIAYTAAFHRDFHERRLIAFGGTRDAIVQSLLAFAAGEPASCVSSGAALPDASRPAFVYSGNGSQWAGMGRTLLQQDDVFRASVLQVDEIFRGLADYSIVSELQSEENSDRMNLTEIAQPTLFAVQVGLTAMLRSRGLTPSAVLGHSVGEVAAAWASGALSLEQAVQVVAVRSRAQGTTRGSGGMTAVGLGAAETETLIAALGLGAQLTVAGFNSPRGVTVAGSVAALAALESLLAEREVFFRRLGLDYAFHSPAMDGIEAVVTKSLAELQPRSTRVPFFSTVTGTPLAGNRLDAHYWWRNIREPVQFEGAIRALLGRGINVFVEVGPHAVLRNYVSDCLRLESMRGCIIPTMLRSDDRLERIEDAFYQVVIAGSPVDIGKLFQHKGRLVDLPRYPWQRERHWHPTTPEAYDLIGRRLEHPLLGYRLRESQGHWENRLDTVLHPELADHVVGDAVVFPAAGFVEMALAASSLTHPAASHEIEELEILAPLVFSPDQSKTVRFSLEPDGSFSIRSRDRLSDEPWLVHVRGRLLGEAYGSHGSASAGLPARPPDWSAADHYRLTRLIGLHYGPAFRTVTAVWLDGTEAVATLLRDDLDALDTTAMVLHPALLDGCFQLMIGVLAAESPHDARLAYVPTKIGQLTLHRAHAVVASARATLVGRTPRSLKGEFRLWDSAGRTVATLRGVRFRAVRLQEDSASERLRHLRTSAVPKPLRGGATGSAVPSHSHLVERLKARLHTDRHTGERRRYYEEIEPLLDVLCASYAERTLRKMTGAHPVFQIDALIAEGAIAGHHRSLAYRLTQILQEDGIIEPTDGGWRWAPESGLPPAEDIWISLIGDYPDYASQFITTGRVGMYLADVLAGIMPADRLVPAGQPQRDGGIGGQPIHEDFLRALGDVVRSALHELPEGKRLSILELAAGNSRFGNHLLPLIDPDRCDYWIAAAGPNGLSEWNLLKERFPGIQLCPLELDRPETHPPLSFRRHFDLILIPDGVSHLPNAANALALLGQLLDEGGVLVLVERHPSRSADLVFGLQPDWWSPGSHGPRRSRQRTPQQWKSLLQRNGFAAANAVPDVPGIDAGAFILLARPASRAVPQAEASSPGRWIIVQQDVGYSAVLGTSLASDLRNLGHHVLQVRPDTHFAIHQDDWYSLDLHSSAQCESLIASIHDNYGDISGLIHLAGLATETDEAATLLDRQEWRCSTVLALLKACEASGTLPALWLVTVRAAAHLLPASARHALGRHPEAFDDAVFWGFGRTLINEFPEMNLRLVDCADPDRLERMSAGLLQELLEPDDEDEVILTGSGRYVTRVGRLPHDEPGRRSSADCDAPPALRLDFPPAGQLKNLAWHRHDLPPIGRDDVEIEVRAAGLNFRDVMYAMGLLSDEAVEGGFAGPTLGMELAGTVVATGPDVTGLQPGQAVIAFAPSSFSTRVITKAAGVVPKPDTWSFESAATVPIAFFTVYYALVHLARLKEGEKVLIHGAAGGVGIAAIQLAKYLGAEIFATAGSDEKRDFVRLLGADHVFDSRALGFADDILQLTDGSGVDVVLNSLAGEAINRNLKVLKPFGRFLELGKRDFYENTKIGLRPFRNNIAYFGIDADQLMTVQPELTRRLFLDLMDLFRQGLLKPLPYRVFAASEAVDAFRYMQQSRHIGKIVLRIDRNIRSWHESPQSVAALELSARGTYLITGGLSGFGLAAAQWMVRKGVRHLVLISRSGTVTPEAGDAIAAMESAGARVTAVACDVTDRCALELLLKRIELGDSPLRGIVHAAAVFDDALARNLTAEQRHKVLAPKMVGALHLHELTRNLALDFLVFFSSATTLFGNPGQAAYVAANHFLEALADFRRANGLPALCIGFGPITDAGYLARNPTVRESLESRLGGAALTASDAMDVLERVLLQNVSGHAVLRFDWRKLRRLLPSAQAAKFERLALESGDDEDDPGSLGDIQRWLDELSDEQLIPLFLGLLKKEVGEILKIPAERLDEHRSIQELGMDSLMGMELITAVESRFGVKLPILSLSGGPTIAKLVERILKQLRTSRQASSASGTRTALIGDDPVRHVASQYAEDLSRERVEELSTAFADRIASGTGSLLERP